jgi:hypothetical protein
LATYPPRKTASPKANIVDEEDDKWQGSDAQALIRHAASAVRFHDVERRTYAAVPVGDHLETMPTAASNFSVGSFARLFSPGTNRRPQNR